jgi:hypothetical protein
VLTSNKGIHRLAGHIFKTKGQKMYKNEDAMWIHKKKFKCSLLKIGDKRRLHLGQNIALL